MRLQLFTYFGFAALTLGLAPACAGGQTGDLSGEHGEGNETGNSNGCEEHKEKLASFDTVTDSGTAEEVMAYAETSFDSPLTWKEPGQGQAWSAGPESGAGALHIEVTRGANAYRLTYSTPPSNGSGAETAAVGLLCPPPQLGVEVHVNVTTEGGALAESYDTLLRTSAPGVATMSVPLDLTKVQGSLAVSSSNPRAKLVQVGLGATFMAEGTSGSIQGIEQTELGSGPSGAISAAPALLAVWPDSAACQSLFRDGGGLGMSVEQSALGVSGADTLADVAADEDITWLDGSPSGLTLSIVSTGDGCFRVSPLPAEAGGGAGVTYPVTIAVKSEDGRLDGTYPGSVVASGIGSARTVTASAYLDLSVDDVAESGFSDVVVPEGSDGLRLAIESKLEGGVASGSVQLVSVENPPCLTNPEPPMSTPGGGMSTPGCSGQERTRLEAASW